MGAEGVAAVGECAARAWAWVMNQVRWDSVGPWIPASVSMSGEGPTEAPPDRDCLYDGIAGLAPALAEIRLAREWTQQERTLADAIISRLGFAGVAGECGLYVGLAGSLVALTVLDSPTAALLARLAEMATPAGWTSTLFDDLGSPVNDLIMGNAGVVMTCAWLGEPGDRLVRLGAEALVASATPAPRGLSWKMCSADRDRVMPNYSHGTAGIAAALAVAGHRLGRADLVEAARLGAEHLVTLADVADAGFRLPLQVPPVGGDTEPYTYGWCHGPTGTANLFGALRMAGVSSVAGHSCLHWIDRADRSVRGSGLPERLRPGFWDNDGRCCGTAGVLDATLNRAQDGGDATHLQFADRLASTLVDRAVKDPTEPGLRYWRHHEHRTDPPDLDPTVGWMQGAAGIAAALARYARIRGQGLSAPRVPLPDDWWMVTDPVVSTDLGGASTRE